MTTHTPPPLPAPFSIIALRGCSSRAITPEVLPSVPPVRKVKAFVKRNWR